MSDNYFDLAKTKSQQIQELTETLITIREECVFLYDRLYRDKNKDYYDLRSYTAARYIDFLNIIADVIEDEKKY